MQEDTLKQFLPATKRWFRKTFGEPTKIQKEAWPAIADGRHVLVSAPTGTGKTLSAFLVFIDQLGGLAGRGELKDELYVIYVSPLKSLAGDIRENLRKPLEGIEAEALEENRFRPESEEPGEGTPGGGPGKQSIGQIQAAIRTGDTPQKERQRMVKHPPHILIITPESLYLMLTSKSGRQVLKTARAIILDELHALIDTKRGAHLMLSVARLDKLCRRRLQRIGLSATIEPLELAAAYLSPEPAVICAPSMDKQVEIQVVGTAPAVGRRKDPVWEELGMAVYRQCLSCKSVIAFSEGRRYVEKLAYYVNLLGGDGFARVHHGSLSKEQRDEVERDLREGRLRLLCATSSMELGIDVGDVERVLQVGCPRTISSTMQRLGRAGHNPGRVSVMYMYPRTAPEAVYCGMTAQVARHGGVERANPPRMCLDVLAQHLVSMASGESYSIADVMEVLERSYPFYQVTRKDVEDVLAMLAGDYEHSREIPARPRILYDRIHGRVAGDVYSRMLATVAGGTIPDKGMYAAKTEDGVKLGELDEEFVYESRIGDRFMLGSFGWRVVRQDKDSVIVTQAPAEGARLPFWKGETKGRDLRTSLAFGRIFGELEKACRDGELEKALGKLGLDESASSNASGFIQRQIQATEGLPDDRTIVVEHFKDSTGSHQVMVHALFGRRVNGPLSLVLRHMIRNTMGLDVGSVDEEDGFLLYPYGREQLPEGLLFQINPDQVRPVLEAILPDTPLFGMTFRYNAARALMMGMKRGGRQPLWMQRLKSTEMLSSLMDQPDHPLIRETKRECLEHQWDISGVMEILAKIRSGLITVREIWLDVPSPMSLPFQWQAEAEEMYEYSPVTPKIRQTVQEDLKKALLKPTAEELSRGWTRKKMPENEEELHSLLMMEGDLEAGELDIPAEWLDTLARQGLACYVEPGIWIAAEHEDEYMRALRQQDEEAGMHIIRRMLYYRGGRTAGDVRERYFLSEKMTEELLDKLCRCKHAVEDQGVYYHEKLYERAREGHIRSLRSHAVTQPASHYAALMASRAVVHSTSEEQLREAMERGCRKPCPVRFWENVYFARRVERYGGSYLDRLLAQGDYFWRMSPEGTLCFCSYEDIDWEADVGAQAAGFEGDVIEGEVIKRDVFKENAFKEDAFKEDEPKVGELKGDELLMYRELKRRGASFLKFLTKIPKEGSAQEVLLSLAEKGLVCADSFVPVRQWQNQDKVRKAAVRQRVNTRVMALSAGRWDIVRPVKKYGPEEWLELFLDENMILCRETFKKSIQAVSDSPYALTGEDGKKWDWSWAQALEILRVWEYTGRIRRGYFVEGMSGAQFVRSEDYDAVTGALREPDDHVVWLNGTDPALVWGKVLEFPEKCGFLAVAGTAVALKAGNLAAVMERQGRVLRIYDVNDMKEVMAEFVRAFKQGAIYPEQKRLVLKEYPAEAAEALQHAGYMREMKDYVVYK